VLIRTLEHDDLHRGLSETLAGLAPVDLAPRQLCEVFRRRQQQGVLTFVCLDGDQVVGTASLVVEQKFIHGGGRVGHVEDVAVRDGHRLRGIGTRLVRHAVEAARREGCYKVILNCTEALADFYRRIGFRAHTLGMRLDL
jgi:glucosamine-phosphate N-acetyltransferase